MDIISHTLTGVAVGTVFATISNSSLKQKGLLILTGGFGGALPDFDAISLWSKFDTTIGSFLGLAHSGKEIYFGKFWYSHHAVLHSILAPIILILTSILAHTLWKKFNRSPIVKQIKMRTYTYLAFFFGFVFHLLEDMPTPASVWGGVNLFYPSSTYVGGYGKIWWWNNYDLVLIICSVIILNLLVNILPKQYYKIKTKGCITVFLLGVALFLVQINTRPIDFSYTGYTTHYNTFELQSKQIQKDVLGDTLFEVMTLIDNKIPLNF